jgi:hypothetical protein
MKLLRWELLEKGMDHTLLMKSSGTGGNNNNWGRGWDDYRGRGWDDNNDGSSNSGKDSDNENNNKGDDKFSWPLIFIGIVAVAIASTLLGREHGQVDWSLTHTKPEKKELKRDSINPEWSIWKDKIKQANINHEDHYPDIFIPVSDPNVF